MHDDASTDSTPAIVAEYADRHPSFIKPIFQTENQYSKGDDAFEKYILPKCRGRYIASCEGDDYWCSPDKLEKQIAYLERHPECPACTHNTWLLDCRDNSRRLMSKMSGSGMIPMKLLLSAGSSYHTSSLVRRRSVYDNLPDYAKTTHGIGDYPLRVYLALNGGVYYLNLPMSVYRYRAKGSWSTRNHADKSLAVQSHKALVDMLHKADVSSHGAYHELFFDAINEQEFMALDAEGEWRKMLSSKYKKTFDNCSLKKRIRIVASALFPGLGRFLGNK